MDRFQTNRPGCRPYTITCGMNVPPGARSGNCCQEYSSHKCKISREPAMAYVPDQEYTTTYDLSYALKVGTLFPQLCKPFCGKRGVRR